MLETYYKGYLRKLADKKVYNKNFFNNLDWMRRSDIGYVLRGLTQDTKYFYHQKYYHEKTIIKDEDAIKAIDFALSNSLNFCISAKEVFDQEIYFRIIHDMNDIYAEEIFTGQIFPILKENNIDTKYSFEKLRLPRIETFYEPDDYFDKSKFKIEVSYDYMHKNIIELNNFIYWPDVEKADDNEIVKYLNNVCKVKKSSGNYVENKKYIDKITKLSNSNVFAKLILVEEKMKEEVEREKIDDISSHMEKIEFLLLKLGKVKPDMKQKYQAKYDKMLENNDNNLTLNPLDVNSLISLETEIEFQIQFNNNDDDSVLKTLDNIIDEYNTNDKTDKTIKDIDQLFELFLHMKSNYSPITRRNSIEKFALIYIYEIYENKDIIRTEDLYNSYINDILKSVIICLNNLIENGEIENNFIINLDENITCDYVIDCIKNINFIKQKVYKKD